jgi:hypothetical protein
MIHISLLSVAFSIPYIYIYIYIYILSSGKMILNDNEKEFQWKRSGHILITILAFALRD